MAARIGFIRAKRHNWGRSAANVVRRLVRLAAAWALLAAILAAVLVTGAGVRRVTPTSRAPALLTEGIAADPCAPQNVIIVPAHRDVHYDGDDSSVLSAGRGQQPAAAMGPRRRAGAPPAMRPRAAGGSRPGPFRE